MIKRYVKITNKGLVRQENQDAFYADVSGEMAFFVVADGMGGHSHGEKASRSITEKLGNWWKSLDKKSLFSPADMVQELICQILTIHKQIYDEFEQENEKGGSTVCAMLIMGNSYIVASVGDSRVYCYEAGMVQISRDDVWQNLPDVRDKLTEEQKCADKRYGRLTQAIGFDEEILPRIARGFLKKGMTFLLCTDGVYKFCPEKELAVYMKTSLRNRNAKMKIERIENAIIKNGARDNYTGILFDVE